MSYHLGAGGGGQQQQQQQQQLHVSLTSRSVHVTEINAAVEKLNSSSSQQVAAGLNLLTKKSYNLFDLGINSLHLEDYPRLVIALGDLLDVIDPLSSYLFENLQLDNFREASIDGYTQWSRAIRIQHQHQSCIKVHN